MKKLILLVSICLIPVNAYAEILFDGSDDYVNVSTSKIIASLTSSTISAWIITSVTGGGSGRAIYCERASVGNDIFKLELQDTGYGKPGNKLLFTHRDDSGTLTQKSGNIVINDGIPHHVAMTKNGTTLTLYVDGVLDITGTISGTDTMTNSINALIGGDLGDSASRWSGTITDVSIYGSTLSNQDIYNLAKSRIKYSPLRHISNLGYWPFDNFINRYIYPTTASIVIDRSSNKKNGTATGGPISSAESFLSYP